MKARNVILAVLLVILLATPVCAGVLDDISDFLMEKQVEEAKELEGKGVVVDFYNNYRTVIDFFVMFMLFTAISYFGLKKFAGEGKGQAAKGIAIAVGLALAFAAIKAGISARFFEPFVKNFLFLIMFFVVFMILRRLTDDKKVFWPLVFAAILTFAAFNITEIVFDEDKKFNLANILSGTPTASEIEELQFDQRKVFSELKAIASRYYDKAEKKYTRKEFLAGEFYDVYDRVEDAIDYQIGEAGKIKKEEDRKKRGKELNKDLKTILGLNQKYGAAGREINILRHNIRPRDQEISLTGGVVNQKLICTVTKEAVARQRRTAEESGATYPAPEYDFVWYKNDKEFKRVKKTDRRDDKIPASEITAVGDKWRCEVTAYIKDSKGDTVTSNTVTIADAETPEGQMAKQDLDLAGTLKVDITPPAPVFAGETFTLQATATGGRGNYVFSWDVVSENPVSMNVEQTSLTMIPPSQSKAEFRAEREGIVGIRVVLDDLATKTVVTKEITVDVASAEDKEAVDKADAEALRDSEDPSDVAKRIEISLNRLERLLGTR